MFWLHWDPVLASFIYCFTSTPCPTIPTLPLVDSLTRQENPLTRLALKCKLTCVRMRTLPFCTGMCKLQCSTRSARLSPIRAITIVLLTEWSPAVNPTSVRLCVLHCTAIKSYAGYGLATEIYSYRPKRRFENWSCSRIHVICYHYTYRFCYYFLLKLVPPSISTVTSYLKTTDNKCSHKVLFSLQRDIRKHFP
jgi:hypothetical protein